VRGLEIRLNSQYYCGYIEVTSCLCFDWLYNNLHAGIKHVRKSFNLHITTELSTHTVRVLINNLLVKPAVHVYNFVHAWYKGQLYIHK
jgi:hypothetical protein